MLQGDTLLHEHGLSLARAAEMAPGVRELSTGGQMGKPVVRGVWGSRVLVLENGFRLEDYSWSDEDGPSIDARLAERIEVIRGPASVLYGSDAWGGVVNSVPAALPDARGKAAFLRTGLETYAALNNSEFGGALRMEGATGSWGGRLFLVGRSGDDLRTPDGEIPHTGFHAENGEAAIGMRGAGGNAEIRYARHSGDFEILEASPRSVPRDVRHESEDNRIQFDGDFLLGALRFEARAQWQGHSLTEVAGSSASAAPGERFHLGLDTYTLDLLAHHEVGSIQSTVGVSGLAQTNRTRGPDPVVPEATVHSGAVFALERIDRGPWTLLAGGRVERRHLDTESDASLGVPRQSHRDIEGTGSGGLAYRVSNGLDLAANVGWGWRPPSLFELSANGPHLGEPRFELGDPDLNPERSLGADARIRLRWRRARLELTGFLNRIDRYVDVVPIGETRIVRGDTLSAFQYTQSDARLAGGELWAEIEPIASLALRVRADHVRGEQVATDRPLSGVPPMRAVFEVECRRDKLGGADRGVAGIQIEHVAAPTRLGPFDTLADSYTLLHFDAGVEAHLGGRPVRVGLRVRNLADRSYRSFLSRYHTFASDPGRNVVLRLSTDL